MAALTLLAAVAVEFGAGMLFYPALRLRRGPRAAVLVAVTGAVLASPWIVPADRRLLRFLASVAAVTVSVKLYDHHVGAAMGRRPGLARFAASLPNGLALVDRAIETNPRPSAGADRRRLGTCGARTVLGLVVCVAAFRVDWGGAPFAIEHAAKVLAYFLVLVPAVGLLASAWRLLGAEGIDAVDNPFASRTPADFWRRYNRPVNQFFLEDLFKPMGGRRSPIRATLAVFAASALIHEYVFLAPIGRVQGFQSAFFLVQGVAVAATLRVRPRGWGVVPWTAGTLAFNLATGVLFFASLGQVVSFYQCGLPDWLGRWGCPP